MPDGQSEDLWAPGARWDGRGTRFRLASRHAEAVELCLFDADRGERHRELAPAGEGRWELYCPDVTPGRAYGYRVHGPWQPEAGHCFNPAKLLVDPGALRVTGEPRLDDALFAFDRADATRPDERDSAPFVPRSVVTDPSFDWGDDRPPRTPWPETVIYECHVRGTTRLHPEVPEALRGTYQGLAAAPVVEHLHRLGVTAVELLPVQQIATEPELVRRGLSNYFGYSPLAFFAPHCGYATQPGSQLVELQRTVRDLHAAGLEVILDVVFNHTAEGGRLGPMLSLKGIDNATYYRLDSADPSRYVDITGCGNTLDARRTEVLDLVLAALVYWVEEVHIDGFRFDLAPVLGRRERFDPEAPFFERLRQHPSLQPIKLIAEPWDLGSAGYRLGHFPAGWREWNDRFRDAVRRFWRGDSGASAAFREALEGSPDTFPRPRRGPTETIDYVTCHDGFTLADLVTYTEKRNHANGEGNRDGSDENLSANWGVEGPSDDAEVEALRRRARKNFLATLALTSGVPMLSHGDEVGRSQRGNNNAYCHDSELTWIDWRLDEGAGEMLAFARRAFALRHRWLDPDGSLLVLTADAEPFEPAVADDRCFAVEHVTAKGRLLLVVNGGPRRRLVRLPRAADDWRIELATFPAEPRRVTTATIRLLPHSLVVLAVPSVPAER